MFMKMRVTSKLGDGTVMSHNGTNKTGTTSQTAIESLKLFKAMCRDVYHWYDTTTKITSATTLQTFTRSRHNADGRKHVQNHVSYFETVLWNVSNSPTRLHRHRVLGVDLFECVRHESAPWCFNSVPNSAEAFKTVSDKFKEVLSAIKHLACSVS